MTADPLPNVVIALDDPAAIARAQLLDRELIVLGAVPTKPFALAGRRLLAYAVLSDAHDCEAALVALSRGVDLVVALHISESLRSSFLDDAARISDVVATTDVGAPELTAEQTALLDGLANGLTLTTVAAALGMSRRTATRRMAEIREAFGVETTVEALRVAPRTSRRDRLNGERDAKAD